MSAIALQSSWMQRVNDWRCPDAGILRSFPFERNHISSEHRNRYTGCRRVYWEQEFNEVPLEQSEKEVEDLHQRTREGIETARLNGKIPGRRPEAKVVTKKSIEAKATILKHSIDFNGTLSDADVMRLAGIVRNTYYKYKRELRTEETEE